MKLVYCLDCDSVVRLTGKRERKCECGKSGGKYLDDLNAEFFGENAVPLGFSNWSFVDAVQNRPHEGLGERFTAFVIPTVCKTMKYVHR